MLINSLHMLAETLRVMEEKNVSETKLQWIRAEMRQILNDMEENPKNQELTVEEIQDFLNKEDAQKYDKYNAIKKCEFLDNCKVSENPCNILNNNTIKFTDFTKTEYQTLYKNQFLLDFNGLPNNLASCVDMFHFGPTYIEIVFNTCVINNTPIWEIFEQYGENKEPIDIGLTCYDKQGNIVFTHDFRQYLVDKDGIICDPFCYKEDGVHQTRIIFHHATTDKKNK